MKKSDPTVSCKVEVDGVSLSVDAINTLRSFQNENNYGLNATIEDLKDAIIWIASQMEYIDDSEHQNAYDVINSLIYVKKGMEKLKK